MKIIDEARPHVAAAAGSSAEALTLAFARATGSRGGKMRPPHYFRIVLELLHRGPCRLLIVGAGNDTELYARANSGGATVVLEHDGAWIKAVQHLECTVLPVSYCTSLAEAPLDPCPLPNGVPPSLLQEDWDVILVDAPPGFHSHAPGRQQSIFLASQLARPGTTVFLHDWDRPAEQSFAARYLKQPNERYGERSVLAVFHYPAAPASSSSESP